MFTLKNFLLAEAEGRDPQVEMDAEKQTKFVSLVADIRKIMGALSMEDLKTAADDPRAFSFMDLIIALDTTEDVIRERLSDEGTMVDVPSSKTTPKKQQRVVAKGKEHQHAEKKNYADLWSSIETQIVETMRNLFAISRSKRGGDILSDKDKDMEKSGKTSFLPRFAHTYNQLVVDKIINALREVGPEQGTKAIGGIIASAKKAVINQEVRSGRMTSAQAQEVLTKARQAKMQLKTPQQRMRFIKKVAERSKQNKELMKKDAA